MNLKTRLKISFVAIVFVPMILVFILSSLIFYQQSVSVREEYGVENGVDIDDVYIPMNLIYRISDRVFSWLEGDIIFNKEKYNDINYLNSVGEYVSKNLAGMAVFKADEMIYSNTDYAAETLNNMIGLSGDNGRDGAKYDEYSRCLIRCLEFKNNKGDRIRVCMTVSLSQALPQVKVIIRQCIIAAVITVLITGIVLTYWVYRAMVRPLNRLKLATNNIKEGNLDFEMNIEGNDEIADVCRNFEEMRRILKDSTEQRMANETEERELIRNISHDLKTPLTAVKGYVEGLLDGVADTPQKQQKYLMTIANKVNDMDRLINELTIYSRIDSNRQVYNYAKVDVCEFFADCVSEIGTELETKGISLEYKSNVSDRAVVCADPEQLKRGVDNIISNSVKYASPDRKCEIVIDVLDSEKQVELSISDNGRGIKEEDLPHVFDRFYRGDSSRNSSTGGSGIGLAIVKKIVEDHKGRVEVFSEVDKGSTFVIHLDKCAEQK